jgi:hypothetical protein
MYICLRGIDFAIFYGVLIDIVAASVIGGRDWSTQRKQLTCWKSMKNFIT